MTPGEAVEQAASTLQEARKEASSAYPERGQALAVVADAWIRLAVALAEHPTTANSGHNG
jgi:hypothetical protein